MKSCSTLAFLWLASSFCHGALPCPELCKCYGRRAEVVCSEVPLTAYPAEGLWENTTMVTVQFTNITAVSERHLNATPLLEGLHLYSNHLRSLSPHLLRGVPRLATLDLTGNELSELPADVFSHAPLLSLVLKNNRLRGADADWLRGNNGSGSSRLAWFDLSGNRLTRVPAALLERLPALENLDLSDNLLEKIGATALRPLTKLERLNLQDNKLVALDASALQGARGLAYLFLSRNKLKKLPRHLFRGLGRLRTLSLDDNQLSHVPDGLLDPLSALDEEGLDLAANPWRCDGKAEYLWRWLRENRTRVFVPETVVCAAPPSLAGRPLISLTESELKLQS